jgi:hypothetical protein
MHSPIEIALRESVRGVFVVQGQRMNVFAQGGADIAVAKAF